MTSTSEQIISRIAPTPSGYLHIGNALNFFLTWEFVRQYGGRLYLRIDDADSNRTRPEYIEDIFRTLEWMGLDWDEGPSGPDDFFAHYSQAKRKKNYFAAIDGHERVYNCRCSRQIIRKTFGDAIYRGLCREKGVSFIAGETAKRIIVDRPTEEKGEAFELATMMGDFVIWTKDDTPAYQLVSLLEDEACRTTHIFRGEDLFTSTLAQRYLAREFGCLSFSRTRIFHHELLRDQQGRKLGKSAGAHCLKELRESGATRQQLLDMLAEPLLRARARIHQEYRPVCSSFILP